MAKVWFVTGSSRGLGRAFVDAALDRGDQVAATARNVDDLADLVDRHGPAVLPLRVDVTNTDEVRTAVAAAHERFGRLDVVVNNAGYGLGGVVEELSEEQLRAQMDTNFLGSVRVDQAVLPLLRSQRGGHIVQISSMGGLAAAAVTGGYVASKWAIEGLTESLAQEVAAFGIRVTLVEPGAYATNMGGVLADPHPAYEDLRAAFFADFAAQRGADPASAAAALLEIVDAEQPPLRVLLGPVGGPPRDETPLQFFEEVYADRLRLWAEWEHLTRAAAGA